MNTSEMSIDPVPSPPSASAVDSSVPPPPPSESPFVAGKEPQDDAQNAHGMAISQLVSPTSAGTPKLERSDPVPVPAATPPPPPPPASTAPPVPASAAPATSAPAGQQDEAMELASPVQPGVMGSGIPLSDARSEKMDVEVKTPSQAEFPAPAATSTPNGPEGEMPGSLKRNSPDDEREVERSPKRIKDEQEVKQDGSAMQVDQESAGNVALQASQESAQPAQSSAESQPQYQSNGAPDPAHPVSDPALLPPQNLYLPGTYLPPTRPPLGSVAPLTYQQYRSLSSLLKSVKKQKDSFAFVAPVDPVALNVPHYFTIIKKPMDLGTVEQKLTQSNPAPSKIKVPGGQQGRQQDSPYTCVADVVNDVRQVWANTRIFNGPQHVVSVSADRLEDFFENQLEKLKLNENPPPSDQAGPSSYRSQGSVPAEERIRRPSVSQPTIRRNTSDDYGVGESSRPKREIHPPTPKDSTWVEPIPQVARTGKGKLNSTPRMKAASRAINDLLTKQKYKGAAAPFYTPVDPIALGIPAYFEVIKRPMDLSTIANKIAQDQYAEVSGVDKDVKLMIKNCFTFNPPGTPVHLCGEQLQKFWNEKWREVLAVPEHEASEEDPALDRELEQLERQRAEISARIDEIHRIKADKGKQKAKPSAHSGGYGSKPAKAGGAGGQYQGAPSKPPAKLGRPAKNGGAGAAAGGPGKAKKQNGGRRPSDVRDYGDSDGEEVMLQVPTLAQKQELADKIADAEPDVLMQALDLIQKTTQLGNHNDEIELDIDALPPNTIAQLYNLVIKGIQPGQAPPKKKKSGPKPGGQNGHHQHGQPGPKRGSKKTGMGGRGAGGAAGKNELEVERIKALEAELSRLNGDEEEDGGEDYGYDNHESGEEDYEGAYSEEEG